MEVEWDAEDVLFAARAGDLDEVKDNLNAGVSLLTKDENGNCVLHMAAANGHLGSCFASSSFFVD